MKPFFLLSRLLIHFALLSLIALPAAATAASVLFAASDYDGAPLSGVAFRILRSGQPEAEIRTDQNGSATVELADSDSTLTVELADSQYRSPAPRQTSSPDARILAFRLFRKPGEMVNTAERHAYAEAWANILRSSDADEYTTPILSNSTLPAPRSWAPLLLPIRDEGDPPRPALKPTKSKIEVRIVDAQGFASAGTVVRLYASLGPETPVFQAGIERANAEGVATFGDLPAGCWFRAEASADGGLQARSSIVFLGADPSPGTVSLRPVMVLRPVGDVVSGVLYDGSAPATGVLVAVATRRGQPPIIATTDERGFFVLGPLPPRVESRERIRVSFRRTTPTGKADSWIQAPRDGTELMVPLQVIERR